MPTQAIGYKIDDILLDPQPTSHQWEDRRVIGHDGDGYPVFAKYSAVTLRLNTAISDNDWRQWVDGASHTVTLPARDTADDWTDYTTVIIEQVTHGAVQRHAAISPTEMRIIHVEE